jgi:cell division protein FtsB
MRYWESGKPKRGSISKSRPSRSPKRSIASGGNLRQYPFLRTFYEHQAGISDRLQKFLFFLALATLLYVFVLGDAGAIRLMSLKREKARLEADVAAARLDIDGLQKEIDGLTQNPYIMERLGRELYGYVSPGDRVYKIIHSKRKN